MKLHIMIKQLIIVLFFCNTMLYAMERLSNYYPVTSTQTQNYRFSTIPQPKPIFTINGQSALLIEAKTTAILYEKDADAQIAPASLTKIMTLYTILDYAEKNNISLDDIIPFGPNAWARNAPTGSSIMSLGPGQRATLKDMLLGISIASGNDAAIAVAEWMSGTVENFIAIMNKHARTMGLHATYFVDSSGYSAHNRTSARDMAMLTINYTTRWSWVISMLHAIPFFSYPRAENQLYADQTFTHYNRNHLIGTIEGIDGLKTGYIPASGYNIIVSAQRHGLRYFAIILGVQADNSVDGSRMRETDAESLLEYGYYYYNNVTLEPNLTNSNLTVYRGQQKTIKLYTSPIYTILPKQYIAHIRVHIEQYNHVIAPVSPDTPIGKITYYSDTTQLLSQPLYTQTAIAEQTGIVRFFSTIALFFRQLGREPIPAGTTPYVQS